MPKACRQADKTRKAVDAHDFQKGQPVKPILSILFYLFSLLQTHQNVCSLDQKPWYWYVGFPFFQGTCAIADELSESCRQSWQAQGMVAREW